MADSIFSFASLSFLYSTAVRSELFHWRCRRSGARHDALASLVSDLRQWTLVPSLGDGLSSYAEGFDGVWRGLVGINDVLAGVKCPVSEAEPQR